MSQAAVLLAAFYGFLVAALSFAWIAGGRAERAGVLLIFGMIAFRLAAWAIAHPQFATIDPAALVEDIAGFAGFTWIGLRARRFWPLCAAALQLLSLGAHFARGLKHSVDPMVYSLMKSLPTLLVCLAIALGAAFYRMRRKAALRAPSPGEDALASWRPHSPD
jgi:hypothetical protein